MPHTKTNAPLPEVSNRRLFASSPDQQEAASAKIEKKTQYGRTYWQKYKKKIKRVFGTLKQAEFAFWKARADQNERSVWTEIYTCACAYVRGVQLPSREIIDQQRALQADIRHIGNNINQAVRLGHIKANHAGKLYAEPSDHIGQIILKGMADLEQCITVFETNINALRPTHNKPS